MKDEDFEDLLESVREMGRIRRGEQPPSRVFHYPSRAEEAVDVSAVRERFGLSRARFAAMLGISSRTLEGWEQGRRKPEGPARVLLEVAARHPETVLQVVRERRARYGPDEEPSEEPTQAG